LNGILIDASVALACRFPDEASDYADEVLVALEGHAILVPTLSPIEITNALLVELGCRVSHCKLFFNDFFMRLRKCCFCLNAQASRVTK